MRLGGVRDGRIYCARGRRVGTWNPDRGFEPRGTLPNPNTGTRKLRFAALTSRVTKHLFAPLTGFYRTSNVWPVGDGALLATSGRWVFRSSDGGRSWRTVHRLPASSGLMGVLPTAVAECDGRAYLAEYSLGDEVARVVASADAGRNWSTLLRRSDVRHFHGLFRDPYTGRLWGTTGDADSESAIGVFEDGAFVPIGRGSQRWRAVDLTFTPDAIFWGMDCSFVDRIEILRLPRDRLDEESPEPEVVGTTDGPVYYAETLSTSDDTWVVVTTAAEIGMDTAVAPEQQRAVRGTAVRVLAASVGKDYETWHELALFTRRSTIAERTDLLPACGAYAYLASSPDLGILVNPYNVRRDHGAIVRLPPETFDSLAGDCADRRASAAVSSG